jgi:hypothetical protein
VFNVDYVNFDASFYGRQVYLFSSHFNYYSLHVPDILNL